VKGRDFLTLAATLATGTSEAAWRSAVSRAYYAAFHVARELLEELGFRVAQADRAHAYLWRRLQNCGDTAVQEAGSDLQDLRHNRNKSDYDFKLSVTKAEALIRLQSAESVVLRLEAAKVEPVQSAIRDTMKIYERNILQEVTWHS